MNAFGLKGLKIDAATLLRGWAALSRLPGGKALFSKVVSNAAPYTATIGAVIEELDVRRATVSLQDRRAIRNHLGSVHAIALANLVEVTSGVAMMSGLPPGMRGIVTRIEVDYLKKARGALSATSTAPVITPDTAGEYLAKAEIFDASGTLVCRGQATWLIRPA